MFDQLKNLKNLRDQAKQLQDTLSQIIIEENDLDGKLKLTVDGNQEIISLEISPELLVPENKEKIENAIKDTFKKAKERAQRDAAMKMQSEGGLPNIPGMG